MLEGAGFRKPNGVFCHGFLTIDGEKMSKSRGTFFNARTYLNHLNPEYLRYYFASRLTDKIEDIDLNFTDFQSRRSKIRLNDDGDKVFPHTLNGSALAVGRTLIALIENFYDEKELIHIPKPLQKYLNKEVIKV